MKLAVDLSAAKKYLPLAAGALALAALAVLGMRFAPLVRSWFKKPVVVLISRPTPTPSPTPVNDFVAFTRAGALWIEYSDGRDAHLLAAPGRDEDFWFPSASPTGDGFLVWLSRGDGTQDVARVDLSGAVDVLTDTGEQAQPSMKNLSLGNAPCYSPDGKQIAYSFNGDLWIMDADGYNAQTLINDGTSWSPAWSPDGKKIAYVNGDEGHRDLWITAVDNHDTYQVTDFDGYSVGSPRWSPAGDHLLLTRIRGDESEVVEVPSNVDAPTADADMLTKDHVSAAGVFNPLGGAICFSSAHADADAATWDLYTVDAYGNSIQQITHGGGLSPAWSRASQTPAPVPALAAPTPLPTPRATAVKAPAAKANSLLQQAPAARSLPTPVAAPRVPLTAATLRLRLRASFDDQDQLDAASMAALSKLARRLRQYSADVLDVVGPLDSSELRGLYASDEARSQARAEETGAALMRLANLRPDRVKAEPYSPPSAGGAAGTVLIYMELR